MEEVENLRAKVEVELFGQKHEIEPSFELMLGFEERMKSSIISPEHWQPYPKVSAAAMLLWLAIGGPKSGKTVKDVVGELSAFKLGQAASVAFLIQEQLVKASEKKRRGRAGGRVTDDDDDPPEKTTWLDLWAIAVYDFGLTDDQFLKLTPLKFDALSRRYDAHRKDQDHHTARVCWASFAAAGAKKKDGSPFTPADFLLKYDGANHEHETSAPKEKIKTTMTALFPLPPHMEWTRRGR